MRLLARNFVDTINLRVAVEDGAHERGARPGVAAYEDQGAGEGVVAVHAPAAVLHVRHVSALRPRVARGLPEYHQHQQPAQPRPLVTGQPPVAGVQVSVPNPREFWGRVDICRYCRYPSRYRISKNPDV